MPDEFCLEHIEGLPYLPQADLPFGKVIRIGPTFTTIYQRAIENGYLAGIQAFEEHLDLRGDVEVPTDHELTNMIEVRFPRDVSVGDAVVWRAYFVVGYTCAHLGLASFRNSE